MDTATATAEQIAKHLAGEALQFGIAYATTNEAEFLADIDANLKTGEHTLSSATVATFKSKIPILGATIGSALGTELDSLEPVAEGAVKIGYDKALAYLNGLAAKLEAA